MQLILVKKKKSLITYSTILQDRGTFSKTFLVRVKVPFSSKTIDKKRPLFFSSPYNGNYFPSTSDQYNSGLKNDKYNVASQSHIMPTPYHFLRDKNAFLKKEKRKKKEEKKKKKMHLRFNISVSTH